MMRSIIGKLVLALVGLLVAILLVEGLARVAGLEKDAGLEPKDYYLPHAEAGYEIARNFPKFTHTLEGMPIDYWSNDIGCFDQQLPSEGEYALLLGDSFTWGFAPYEQKWGTYAERLAGLPIAKCGVNGYGTYQELVHARDMVERIGREPKTIILGYFYNDLANDWILPNSVAHNGRLVQKTMLTDMATGEVAQLTNEELDARAENYDAYCKTFVPRSPLLMRGVCFLKKHSVLYPYVKDAGKKALVSLFGNDSYSSLVISQNPLETQTEYLAFLPTSTYPWIEDAWERHLGNLEDLHEFAKSQNAELVVALIPYKAMVYEDLAAEAERQLPEIDLASAPARVMEFLENRGIKHVDFTPEFLKYATTTSDPRVGTAHDLYWTYDGHWNPRGNFLAGLLLAKRLISYNLVNLTAEERTLALERIEQDIGLLHTQP